MASKVLWKEVLKVEELAAEDRGVVDFEGEQVLIVKADGSLFAVSNRCPHLGCALSKGRQDGPIITCPCHDWRFDLRTGEFVDAPEISLRTYHLRADSGKVLLQGGGANR
jgi:nitrite reductase/ring-hydroxylating ferredoxin subunit